MICPKCGKENTEGTMYCSECGTSLAAPADSDEINESIVANFVGNNQSYYVAKWKMMKKSGSKVS